MCRSTTRRVAAVTFYELLKLEKRGKVEAGQEEAFTPIQYTLAGKL